MIANNNLVNETKNYTQRLSFFPIRKKIVANLNNLQRKKRMPCILKLKIIQGRNLFIDSNSDNSNTASTATTAATTASFIEIKFNDDVITRTSIRRGINPVFNEDFKFEFLKDFQEKKILELKLYECSNTTTLSGSQEKFRGFILYDLVQLVTSLSSVSSSSSSVVGGELVDTSNTITTTTSSYNDYNGYVVLYDTLSSDVHFGIEGMAFPNGSRSARIDVPEKPGKV